MALDHNFACLAYFRFEHRAFLQPAHQHTRAAIDKAFRQTFVQRVGKFIFYRAGDTLPMLRIGKPIETVGNKGPGSDMRDTVGQGIDAAIGVIRLCNLMGKPVIGDMAVPHQKSIKGDREFRVGRRRDLAIIRNLADIP